MAETREVLWKLRVVEHEDNARLLAKFKKDLGGAGGGRGAGGASDEDRAKRAREKEEREAKKQQERIFRNRVKLLDRIAKEERKKRTETERESKRLLANLERQHESAVGRISAGNAQLIEGFSAAAGSIMQFGRGLALVGIAGEEDTKKLLQSLIKVQAVFDLMVGGVQTAVNITKAVKGFQAALSAASAAETAQRTRNLALARAQLATEVQLGRARGASGAAGAASGAAGAGGRLLGTGGTIAGGAGLAKAGGGVAGAAGPAAAAVAAIAAVTAALVTLGDAVTGNAKIHTSFSAKIARAEIAMAKFITRFTGFGLPDIKNLVSQDASLKRQEGRLSFRRSGGNDPGAVGRRERQNRINDQFALGRVGSQARAAERDFRLQTRLGGVGAAGQVGLIQQEQASVRMQQANSRATSRFGGLSGDAQGQARQDVLDTTRRLIDLEKQRLSIGRQITMERKKGAEEAVKSATRELEIVQDRISRERNRVQTAKERFGQLDRFQQARLIGIKGKADQQGFGSLSAAERQALRGVGTQGAEDIARRGDLASATRGGFDQAFGGTERRNINQLTKQSQQLQVTIRDQRKLVVQIDREEDQLAASAATAIAEQLQIRDAVLARKISSEVAAAERRLSQSREQEQAARRGVVGR